MPDLAVRGYSVTHPSGTVILPTAPGWDHLVFASSGVMTVGTPDGEWVVPPHRALWAPSGVPFRIQFHGRVAVRTLYLRTELRALPGGLRAVNVPALARELILHAVETSPLDLRVPEHERLIGVLVDQLAALPQAPLPVPRPSDPRAQALCDLLAADPGTERSLGSLAAQVGASRRTLERLFAVRDRADDRAVAPAPAARARVAPAGRRRIGQQRRPRRRLPDGQRVRGDVPPAARRHPRPLLPGVVGRRG